jgi:hypothetical protein
MRPLFVAVFAAASLTALGAQAQDWSAAAAQDLPAIRDALRENSPEVYVDKDSATFRSWLDAGLAQAQAQPLAKADNSAAYADALRFYAVGFRDANIAVEPNWAPPPLAFAIAWPGFATKWQGGAYVVSFNDPSAKGLPPVGAKVISCDRTPIDTIAKQRLDRYEADLTTESGRFESAPYLLWDRANTMLPILPQKCDFDMGNGRKRTFNITPQIGGEALREQAYQISAPKASGLGLEGFGSGGFWINLHSLSDQQNWTPFLTQIDQNAAAIRAAPVIVIDLRGADGGSIRNGYRVIDRIWDPDFVASNNPPATNVVFRTSKANQDFYRALATRLGADPMTATEGGMWGSLADALAQAAAQNQPTLARNESATQSETPAALAPTIPTDENGKPLDAQAAAAAGAAPAAAAAPPPPAAAPKAPPPDNVRARVIVLTDYWCSGACLNLLDVLTRFPGVQLAGTQTSADSIFIGGTTITLPSGHARIAYGDKAWIDRPRGSNVPYTPVAGLTYTGDLGDNAAVKAWVAQIVGH